jgi:TetR/AcrR family transcriptional regulator, repressor of fatR-cypB operon
MSVRTARAKVAPIVSLPKREAILRAALEVFSEYGVHGVAVPEIAARAGVGTGTIYRFFESKEALVNELYRECKRSFGRRLVDLAQLSDAKAQFTEFWKIAASFVREEPEAFRFLELQDHLPYLDEESRELEKRVLSPIAKNCRSLQRRGIYRSDVRAEVLMALHWGCFVNLFKSERQGYVNVKPRDITAACEAAWNMCATPEHAK